MGLATGIRDRLASSVRRLCAAIKISSRLRPTLPNHAQQIPAEGQRVNHQAAHSCNLMMIGNGPITKYLLVIYIILHDPHKFATFQQG